MEGKETLPLPPPPRPPTNPPYLFTPSLPPLIPSTQPHVLQDINWYSLFSSPAIKPNDQNPLPETGFKGEEEEDKKKERSRVIKSNTTPRFAFRTRSDEDILDDGYRWRKYGQKSVKDSIYPRSYYRCAHHTCNVKKQVQRLTKDTSIVVTTYEGVHTHPCDKFLEVLSPLLNQIPFHDFSLLLSNH